MAVAHIKISALIANIIINVKILLINLMNLAKCVVIDEFKSSMDNLSLEMCLEPVSRDVYLKFARSQTHCCLRSHVSELCENGEQEIVNWKSHEVSRKNSSLYF